MTPAAPERPPSLSVVIPVHDEEGNLHELHRRLDAVLRGLGMTYEIIYVDDGSADGSLAILLALRRQATDRVVVVELYRNYGQFRALMAGFERVRGDVVVTLDSDLQNPPEEIPRLLACLEEGGYDVVNGWRRDRRDSAFRRLASRVANRIAASVTGVRMRDYGCMLRAYRSDVVRQVAACNEHSPYIPTLANALARRATEIEVAHAPRRSGESKYSLWNLIHLQYDMITSFSVLPLRWMSVLGLVTCALAMAGGAAVLGAPLFGLGAGLTPVYALVVLMFLLIGVMFLSLGLVGEYVGRIYNEVRQRPRFVVRRAYTPSDAVSDKEEGVATEPEKAAPLIGLRDDGRRKTDEHD